MWKNLKISTRISLTTTFFIIVTLLVIGFVGLYLMNIYSVKITKTIVKNFFINAYELIEREHNLLTEDLKKDLKVAHHIFYSKGNIIEYPDKKVKFKAINQITKEQKIVEVPLWELDGMPVQNHYEIVDLITSLTGATATIFQRIDDGFLRISTSVRKKDGTRATGTYIPNDSPVIQTILKGDTFYGRAFVVDDWYITAYEPIRIDGKIKGILYVGIKEKNLEELKNALLSIRIGKNGFPFVINDEGDIIIHPYKSGKNVKDVELFKKIKSAKEGFIFYKDNGLSKYMYYKYYPQYKWYIGFTASPGDIFGNAVGAIMNITLLAALIFIVLGFIASFFIGKSISNPINKVVGMLKEISEGEADLTQRLPEDAKDETGELAKYFNKFLEKLREIIISFKDVALQVSSVSAEMDQTLDKITDSASSLASTSQETSATVQEITSSIEEVANNAQDIATSSEELARSAEKVVNDTKKIGEKADVVSQNSEKVGESIERLRNSIDEAVSSVEAAKIGAEETKSSSDEGRMAIDASIKGMQRISERVDDLANIVNKLGKSGEEIGKIIDVISDIADQTNLLALNAAIEAARAGDAGRGFAVVAEEVRKLAERSQEAAGEIGELIRGIQAEVQNAVKSSEEGKREVENGMNLAKKAGDTFEKINNSILNITDIIEKIYSGMEKEKEDGVIAEELTHKSIQSINEITNLIKESVDEVVGMGNEVEEVTQRVAYISAATEEQAAAAKEMRKAVETIAMAAEESASAIAEASQASSSLAEYAEKLAVLVKRFKV